MIESEHGTHLERRKVESISQFVKDDGLMLRIRRGVVSTLRENNSGLDFIEPLFLTKYEDAVSALRDVAAS